MGGLNHFIRLNVIDHLYMALTTALNKFTSGFFGEVTERNPLESMILNIQFQKMKRVEQVVSVEVM